MSEAHIVKVSEPRSGPDEPKFWLWAVLCDSPEEAAKLVRQVSEVPENHVVEPQGTTVDVATALDAPLEPGKPRRFA